MEGEKVGVRGKGEIARDGNELSLKDFDEKL